MTPERWRRTKELFSEAIALPEAERRARLGESCAGDDELFAEVESLLAAHAAEDAVVDRPAAAHLDSDEALAAADPWLGRRIGPYEIVSLIGRGGMGEVYRARRVDAEFEKEVAIKLMPGGFHASFMLQRFRAERQILASLEHPHIARLIDGGATDGSPYLVMELVEGEPIDRYCTERQLPQRDRLRLFIDVCAAVGYAHQRLVVHRDLKPGNILVTADGAVKLLDFGVAKLIQPATQTATAEHTVTVMHALTPAYSSPEQILGKPITTASDVYSLGVVLYVILTGRSPYRRSLDTAEDAIREVCDTEPVRPSEALRANETAARESIGRDLDAIILRALRKEPERRYATVEQLCEDVRRHLDGRPVIARGDQFGYRAAKFMRRHRFEMGAALLLVVTLVAATLYSLREARIADEQRARAERHFASVRGLANAFMFDVNDEIEKLPGATRAREVLVGTALKYLDALAQESGTDTGLKLELAAAFEKVANIQGQAYAASKGNAPAAIASYTKALELLEPIVSTEPDNVSAARALARVSLKRSQLLLLRGSFQEAVAESGRAVELLEKLLKTQPETEIQHQLARALTVHSDNEFYASTPRDERLEHSRQAVAILEELDRRHPENAQVAKDLSSAYSTQALTLLGDAPDPAVTEEALMLYRKALAIDERLAAESGGHNVEYLRRVAVDRSNMAIQLHQTGDVRGALESLRVGKAVLTELAADTGDLQVLFDAAISGSHEGRYLSELGEAQEAETVLRNTIEAIEKLGVEDDNLQIAWVRGTSETVLGLIEVERATSAGIGRAARLHHWNEARHWFQQATPRFDRVTAVAKLGYLDIWAVNGARDGLARSEAEIAKLTAEASSR
jgi:serine/threonine-protein kinase